MAQTRRLSFVTPNYADTEGREVPVEPGSHDDGDLDPADARVGLTLA